MKKILFIVFFLACVLTVLGGSENVNISASVKLAEIYKAAQNGTLQKYAGNTYYLLEGYVTGKADAPGGDEYELTFVSGEWVSDRYINIYKTATFIDKNLYDSMIRDNERLQNLHVVIIAQIKGAVTVETEIRPELRAFRIMNIR